MSFLALFAFSVALFAAHGQFLRHDDAHNLECLKVNVDEYLDRVLAKARTELPDPIRLPPRQTIVHLSDGVLWGLSNLTRKGQAKVTCKDPNTIVIHSKLTTDQLKGRYTWNKENRRDGQTEREGYVVFISDDFEAEATVVIEKKEGEQTHPRLEEFKINRFKDARIEMTGMGIITWALGEMTTLISGIFQRAIGYAVQGPVQEALERQMREITIE